ncbi:helix-turn-helix domain-containing protein [Parapedobacter sp. 10938]|uniref:helix-turn-helix domain-containing protein n=1 Tax=Parapedobacter flavus TaxID=3110225 RepID=UPI002DBCDAAA|nr:AraC family transcriptional regulator [Parapedobacter sp. 10938]MEC3880209.1 AraC family transcriptional regulator [Parapedobacter sp. 10938]
MGKRKAMILFEADLQRLEAIRVYIGSHLSSNLSTERLASLFDCNPSRLKRQFQHVYKMTLRKYILECRMLHAQTLIHEKNATVCEIASSVGYKNRTSFTHAFRSFFGYAPFELLMQQMSRQKVK